MDYNWYTRTSSNQMEQGDFILDCQFVEPPHQINPEDELFEINVKIANSILLSQSCDLLNSKTKNVIACPYFTLQDHLDSLPPKDRNSRGSIEKVIKDIRSGRQPAYHLLNSCPALDVNDYLVVNFKNVFGVHIDYLKDKISKEESRLRLLPPYREHLSQAFARYFMRVGLPTDIRVQTKYNDLKFDLR